MTLKTNPDILRETREKLAAHPRWKELQDMEAIQEANAVRIVALRRLIVNEQIIKPREASK